jgi:ABC-type Mn2+/Zn2+ transport system ATPase subunit
MVGECEMALECRLAEAGYGREAILRNLELRVRHKEFVAILGDNGAGKTTLFRAILHLLPKQRGTFRVLGRQIRSKEDQAWIRSQVGYVPQRQEKGRFPISVFDAVLLGRWGKTFSYFRRPGREDRRAVDHMLALIGLEALRNQDCRNLSGGQMQRLNIARALVREPRILLLDEPATHLDAEAQSILSDLVRGIRDHSDLTVLMISHDRIQAEAMADRVVYIRQGSLHASPVAVP